MAELSQETALERFAGGCLEEDTFEAAVPEISRLIRGYLAWARVGQDAIEDLAQEAIVRVYLRREDRRGTTVASLRAWLRVICRNLALSAHARKTPVPVEDDFESESADDRLDLRDALRHCIDGLREPDRTVFRLRFLNGLSTREIAELQGWKVRNCEHVLARARASLERALRREGYGDA